MPWPAAAISSWSGPLPQMKNESRDAEIEVVDLVGLSRARVAGASSRRKMKCGLARIAWSAVRMALSKPPVSRSFR